MVVSARGDQDERHASGERTSGRHKSSCATIPVGSFGVLAGGVKARTSGTILRLILCEVLWPPRVSVRRTVGSVLVGATGSEGEIKYESAVTPGRGGE
jgi:hypothetical protein